MCPRGIILHHSGASSLSASSHGDRTAGTELNARDSNDTAAVTRPCSPMSQARLPAIGSPEELNLSNAEKLGKHASAGY